MSDYPEHDKMKLIADTSQAIGEFIEWLPTRHLYLGQEVEDSTRGYLYPWCGGIENLLADFFEIDLTKIETEKQAMLDRMREMNA